MTPVLPEFAVIVPTRGRPGPLHDCLASLARLNYPEDRFRVIVVDDSGGDTEVAIPEKLRAVVLRQTCEGPAAARNRGAAAAPRESMLAFVDDDCTVDRGWLGALAAAFALNSESVVGGAVSNALPENTWAAATHHLIDVLKQTGRHQFLTSNNLALPKHLFDLVGGFDATFGFAGGEDREFCARCVDHGLLLLEAPEALVLHAHDLTLQRFLGQHFRYGRGARALVLRRRMHAVPTTEPVTFAPRLVFSAFRAARGRRALRLAAALALSQLATAAGYAVEAARPRIPRGG